MKEVISHSRWGCRRCEHYTVGTTTVTIIYSAAVLMLFLLPRGTHHHVTMAGRRPQHSSSPPNKCVCGEHFSKERDLTRHQGTCRIHKQHSEDGQKAHRENFGYKRRRQPALRSSASPLASLPCSNLSGRQQAPTVRAAPGMRARGMRD